MLISWISFFKCLQTTKYLTNFETKSCSRNLVTLISFCPKNMTSLCFYFLFCKLMNLSLWLMCRASTCSDTQIQKQFQKLNWFPNSKFLFVLWKHPEIVSKNTFQRYFELKLKVVQLFENWPKQTYENFLTFMNWKQVWLMWACNNQIWLPKL